MSSSDLTTAAERTPALSPGPLPIPSPHSASTTREDALIPGEGREGVTQHAASDHPAAALTSEASGQRGNSIVRAHSASEDARERADNTRPEPGSSARAGLASPTAILLGSLGFGLLFLLAWQFLPPALGVPSFIIPTVTDLVREFGRMVQRENLMVHILSTATIATIGFVIGSFLGAAMGYVLGMSVFVEKVLSPYLLGLQIAPKVAFAPLFIMWLGYNAWPKLLVTILVVFFPILVNVLQSMKTVDRDLINLARAYSMNRLQIFWKIEVPTSMPALMAGLRIGATLAVIGVTVGELVGGNTGLGYLITFGEGQANTAMVFNAIVLLTLIGILLYGAVAMIEARVLHYIPRAMR